MQVIDRMMDTVTVLKDKIEIIYKDVLSIDAIENYGNIEPPANIHKWCVVFSRTCSNYQKVRQRIT